MVAVAAHLRSRDDTAETADLAYGRRPVTVSKPNTHHQLRTADILFSDGHVVSRSNPDGRFTVDVRDYSQLHDTFNKILQVLEQADTEP